MPIWMRWTIMACVAGCSCEPSTQPHPFLVADLARPEADPDV